MESPGTLTKSRSSLGTVSIFAILPWNFLERKEETSRSQPCIRIRMKRLSINTSLSVLRFHLPQRGTDYLTWFWKAQTYLSGCNVEVRFVRQCHLQARVTNTSEMMRKTKARRKWEQCSSLLCLASCLPPWQPLGNSTIGNYNLHHISKGQESKRHHTGCSQIPKPTYLRTSWRTTDALPGPTFLPGFRPCTLEASTPSDSGRITWISAILDPVMLHEWFLGFWVSALP